MHRKEFLKVCTGSCLGIAISTATLSSCVSHRRVNAVLKNEYLEVPLVAFAYVKKGESHYHDYVVARNPLLEYPICIFRQSDDIFNAFLMKCTHQGAVLKLYGDTLQCAAHGSEFNSNGQVTIGPATTNLRSFETKVDQQTVRILLK